MTIGKIAAYPKVKVKTNNFVWANVGIKCFTSISCLLFTSYRMFFSLPGCDQSSCGRYDPRRIPSLLTQTATHASGRRDFCWAPGVSLFQPRAHGLPTCARNDGKARATTTAQTSRQYHAGNSQASVK